MAYSHSRLKVFEDCQLRFRYKYIDKIPEPDAPKKPALVFGTLMHSALEILYKKLQSSGTYPEPEELKTYIQTELERTRQNYDRMSDVPLSPASVQEYCDLGSTMIDRYYETYAPFHDTKVNGLEKMFSYDLPNGQKLTGVIDRFDIDGDVATIVDYKTDREIKTLAEFESSHQQQLNTYAAWILANYPHIVKNIRGKLIYLRLGQEITREMTSEMIMQAIQIITDQISVIENTLFRYNMGEKDAFGPNEGPQCRRCAYQVMCPLWKHRFQADEEVIVSEIGETTIKKLVDKFYHLNNQKKELEDQMKGIKEFLEEYVASHADEEWKKLYGEDGELKVDYKNEFKPREDKNTELKQLLLDEGLLDLLTMQINTSKLTKYLADHPEKMTDLASLIEHKEKYTVGWAREKKELK